MQIRFAPAFVSFVSASAVLAACSNPPADTIETLSLEERDARFIAAIRDAGYICDEVVDAFSAEGSKMAWRVTCNDALAYLTSVDDGGNLHVEPLAYSDPVRPAAPPQFDPDRPRPPP